MNRGGRGGRRRPYAAGGLIAAAALLAACGGGRPGSRAVEIRAFRYAPDTAAVSVGDTLVWTNHDMVPHTATLAEGGWDSGAIAPGQAGRWVPDRVGTHEYLCAYHPTMRGTIVVR